MGHLLVIICCNRVREPAIASSCTTTATCALKSPSTTSSNSLVVTSWLGPAKAIWCPSDGKTSTLFVCQIYGPINLHILHALRTTVHEVIHAIKLYRAPALVKRTRAYDLFSTRFCNLFRSLCNLFQETEGFIKLLGRST
jgi:hypothetical protein